MATSAAAARQLSEAWLASVSAVSWVCSVPAREGNIPAAKQMVQWSNAVPLLQVNRSTGGSIGSLAAHDPQQDVPFDDVRLGGLLGKGSFGSVFIGVAGGTPCAVKVRVIGFWLFGLSIRGWADCCASAASAARPLGWRAARPAPSRWGFFGCRVQHQGLGRVGAPNPPILSWKLEASLCTDSVPLQDSGDRWPPL